MSETTSLARVFIGSSTEGSALAHHLQSVLERRSVGEVTVWDQGVFTPSSYTLDALTTAIAASDFAVLVATGDDSTISRGQTEASPRDNVILEFGLCLGSLGRERTFLLAEEDVKLPTDVLGLTRLGYRSRTDGNLRAALNEPALQIETEVKTHGPKCRSQPTPGENEEHTTTLDREIEILCANATAQGWTVKTNSLTTLRLVPPRGRPTFALSKTTPGETRERLRPFVAKLRASGLRINSALRNPAEKSPL